MINFLATFALLLADEIAKPPPVVEASGGDQVARARKSLLDKITEARSAGVVKMKDDDGEPATQEIMGQVGQMAPPPSLRDAIEGDCLNAASLARRSAASSTDPIEYLDELRAATDKSTSGKGYLALAEAYLALGFFDEASASVREIGTPRAAALATLAAIANRNMNERPLEKRHIDQCGEFYAEIDKVARYVTGGAPALTREGLAELGRLPPIPASAIFDSISYAAIGFDQLPLARLVEEVRNSGSPEAATSVTASFVHAAISAHEGDAAARRDLLQHAGMPTPEGHAALKQLAENNFQADFDEVEQAQFFDSLEDALSNAGGAAIESLLAMKLAERRLQSGNWVSAAKLYLRVSRTERSEGNDAAHRAKEIVEPQILEGAPDQKFAALNLVFEYKDTLAPLLGADASKEVLKQIAAIGATELVEQYLDASGAKMPDEIWRAADSQILAGGGNPSTVETATHAPGMSSSDIDGGQASALSFMQKKAPTAAILSDVATFSENVSEEVEYLKAELSK